jgi:hypothetical protein
MRKFCRSSRVLRSGGESSTAALALVLAAGASADAGAEHPLIIGSTQNETRFALARAFDGAARRLADPGCREILGDFSNADGLVLREVLKAESRSVDAAFSGLRFFDDRDASVCTTRTALAFTEPGSRVIHVCGQRFAQRFTAEPSYVEFIVIHEFLDALGLGENPSLSSAITARVKMRCAA